MSPTLPPPPTGEPIPLVEQTPLPESEAPAAATTGDAAPAASARRRRRLVRIATVAIPVLLLLAYALPSAIVAERLSARDRQVLSSSPADLGLPFEDVSFPSRDDQITLRGWWIPGAGLETVILVHGIDSIRDDPDKRYLPLAGDLAGVGYNILLFDLRGHGTSDFARFTLGVHEPRDVLGAVDYVAERGIPLAEIAVLGFSTGAVSALEAAVREPGLGAVIADGAWPDLRELLNGELPDASGLPALYNPGIVLALRIRYGVNVDEAVPADDVATLAAADFPLLLIHGTADAYTSMARWQRLADAVAEDGRGATWVVDGVPHVRAYALHPGAYLDHVLPFLANSIESP